MFQVKQKNTARTSWWLQKWKWTVKKNFNYKTYVLTFGNTDIHFLAESDWFDTNLMYHVLNMKPAAG